VEPQTSPGHHGAHTTSEQRRKNTFPRFFPSQEGILLDLKEPRRAEPAWGPRTATAPGPPAPPSMGLWRTGVGPRRFPTAPRHPHTAKPGTARRAEPAVRDEHFLTFSKRASLPVLGPSDGPRHRGEEGRRPQPCPAPKRRVSQVGAQADPEGGPRPPRAAAFARKREKRLQTLAQGRERLGRAPHSNSAKLFGKVINGLRFFLLLF